MTDSVEPAPVELETQQHAYPWKPVPDWVTWSPISDGAYRVYTRIMSLANDGRIWYRSERLAALIGISEASLHRHMKTLEKRGMVDRVTRRNDKGQRVSTVYRIIVEPAESPDWPINGAQARRRIE